MSIPTNRQKKVKALLDLADSMERDLRRAHNERFTLGPWRVGISAASKYSMMNYYVFAEREFDPKHPFAPELFICRTDSTIVERDAGEKEANAALIAAAPEMYDWQGDTLDVLCQICRSFNTPDNIRIQLEPMIFRGAEIRKKARGEE